MWKTVLILIITIVLVPFLAFVIDEPLSLLQQDILRDLIVIYLIAAFLCFIVSLLSDNYSQVDKLWSTIPVVYVWLVAVRGEFEPRLVLMAILVSLWGIRLTYNFSRRGGYSIKFWSGEEDYRWAVLRSKPEFRAKWKWIFFNLFFISLYQMGLILMFTLPILKSMNGRDLAWIDIAISMLFILFLSLEAIADQQQWNYQNEKKRFKDAGSEIPELYRQGFISTGLWGRVRHPNYTSELAIWLVFYLFSVSATGLWLNWSITGALLLIMLFWGSSNFSESISAGKYPEYKNYQQQAGRFIPNFLKK